MDPIEDTVMQALAGLRGVATLQVAYSGGLDSTVLLHALAALRPRLGPALEAVHVHHGLQGEADAWVRACERTCRSLGVPLRVLEVDARPAPGESPEAAARRARYRALGGVLDAQTCLATAHHLDDQAETLLLQLLRGAGPAGLAAMPVIARLGAGWHVRPLLGCPREALHDYARRHGLSWVEDASNLDTRYGRNYLRQRVLPVLRQRWPSASRTLARAAHHQAEAAELLGELAEQDRATAPGSRPGTLSVRALAGLSQARQANLLRHWIRGLGLPVPDARQLAQVRAQALGAHAGRSPCVRWSGAELRRYRDDLHAMAPLPPHDPAMVLRWDPSAPLPIPHLGLELRPWDLQRLGVAVAGQGLTVRFRRGGERCRPAGAPHHRSLKKLFQEAGVPPWERERIPLIYAHGRLAAVMGHWACD
jgi:tRNA(Ile)-lysidine synthase